MRKVTQETLSGLDDEMQGDTTIENLFCGATTRLKKVASVDRDSGTSLSPVGVSELNLTTETEETMTENSMPSARNSSEHAGAGDGDNSDDEEEVTFRNFNTVDECAKLRKEHGEPFCGGSAVWERRRLLWTQPVDSQINVDEFHKHKELFATIPQNYYTRIYKNLVLDDKPLREPLNLQDAIKVINAGWVETRKWENAAKGLA